MCFPNPVSFERRMQHVLLGVFIQLGIHMVDTVPEGIRVKITQSGLKHTISPNSLSTGTQSREVVVVSGHGGWCLPGVLMTVPSGGLD